jgi:septal ring factor EnvC (AmiA/AmiB activator)
MFTLFSVEALAQTDKKEQLRIKKTQLQDEIDLANKILKDTKKTERVTLAQMQALEQKIRFREELIRTIDRELRLMDREIAKLQAEADTLQKQMDKMKAEYARMIQQSYKQRNQNNKLLFILSSKDFTQAAKRMAYMKQYSDYRKQQVKEIEEKQAALRRKIAELETRKIEQAKLKIYKQDEKETLVDEQEEQEKVISDLKKRENEIQKEIKAKQAEANKLEKEIERLIADEMKKAREKAARESLEKEAEKLGLVKGKDFTDRTDNKKLNSLINEKRKSLNLEEKPETPAATSPGYALTPEAKQLAANFAANKGKLPWPVERGMVVGKFGKQPHPVAKGIIVNNPHIEIATETDANARAAFEGVVSSVIRIPGANKAVLVSHGNYYTVYGNLVDVYVKSGDKVTVKQTLGKIYTDKDNRSVLQFGLWLDDKIQDPEPWLVKSGQK